MMDAGYKTVGLFELAKNLSINPETAFSDTDHAMFNIDSYVEEKVKKPEERTLVIFRYSIMPEAKVIQRFVRTQT